MQVIACEQDLLGRTFVVELKVDSLMDRTFLIHPLLLQVWLKELQRDLAAKEQQQVVQISHQSVLQRLKVIRRDLN